MGPCLKGRVQPPIASIDSVELAQIGARRGNQAAECGASSSAPASQPRVISKYALPLSSTLTHSDTHASETIAGFLLGHSLYMCPDPYPLACVACSRVLDAFDR